MIEINSGVLTIPETDRCLGVKGDNNKVTKQFLLLNVDDINASYELLLDFHSKKEKVIGLDKKVTDGFTTLYWVVKTEDLLEDGVVTARVKAKLSDGCVFTTTHDYFLVALDNNSIISDNSFFENTSNENSNLEKYSPEVLDEKFDTINTRLDNVDADFVRKNRTLAKLDLSQNRSANELQDALSVHPVLLYTGEPITSTTGKIGQFLYDVFNEKLWLCKGLKDDSEYVWQEVSSYAQGADGADGKSAYQIALDNGFEGTQEEWLKSLHGANGYTPRIGNNGNWFIGSTDTGFASRGEKGEQGIQGDKGDKGENGKTPIKGVDYFTDGDKQELVETTAEILAEGLETNIPDYYNDYLSEKIETIKALQESAGFNGSAFIQISDSHDTASQPYAAPLAKKIMDECHIKHIFHTGDLEQYSAPSADTAKTSLDRGLTKFKSVIDDIVVTAGNHDGAYGETDEFLIPKNALYAHFGIVNNGKADNYGAENGYCYVDDEAEKTRYIVLNTQDCPNITDAPKIGVLRQAQYDWLAQALNVNDGWIVICFCHIPPTMTYETASKNLALLDDFLGAYKDKTSIVASYIGNFSGSYTNLFSQSAEGFANDTDFSGASSGRFLTNYIPCNNTSVIHIKGATAYKIKGHNSVTNQWGDAIYANQFSPATADYDSSVTTYTLNETIAKNCDMIQLEIRSGNTDLDNVVITANQNIEGESGEAWDALTLNHDFSDYNGDLVGLFCGHAHEDYTWLAYPITNYKCNIQSICCDARGLDGRSYNNDASFLNRAVGTVYENCFDVVVVNKANRKVNCVRIGAGYDREFTY